MRTKFFTLLFTALVANVFAQSTSTSPFSTFGFGEKGGVDHASFTALGNCNLTYFDSTVLNFYNPATYNTLGEGQPLFSIGVTSRMSFYEQNGSTSLRSSAYADHFAMGFTLKKHFGLAFGLKPYSRKGYDISETNLVGTDSIEYNYLGSGGINDAFLGLSSNILKYKKSTLSIGANVGYLFGTTNNERRSVLLDNNGIGGVDYQRVRLSSLHYEFGAYFNQKFKDNHSISVAMVLEPSQKLTGTLDEYLFKGTVSDPRSYDTLYAAEGQEGNIFIAPTLSFGINYNLRFTDKKKNNTERNSELGFHINYSTTDWTRFSSTFYNSSSLLATSKLNFGLQYTPECQFLNGDASTKLLEQVRYRVGFYQYTLPYSIDGLQVKDFGTTFGFGIPILGQPSLSSVNFGFALGIRETGGTNSLNEKYIGINFGVSLAPSKFDRWFRKRKLD